MRPGISERAFEFCYNAEFVQQHRALLATHPLIPSQREERDLGYDVELRIREGKFTRSIFLQHKGSSRADNRAGRNAAFYDTHNGSYFRFAVDNDQHNTLVRLGRNRGNAFYCAPRFHTRRELESHFWASAVMASSVWLNPVDVGELNDGERHNVTYDPTGHPAYMHSDPQRFESVSSVDERLPRLSHQEISSDFVSQFAEELTAITLDSKFRRQVPQKFQEFRRIEQVQYLLAHVYDVSWLLLP